MITMREEFIVIGEIKGDRLKVPPWGILGIKDDSSSEEKINCCFLSKLYKAWNGLHPLPYNILVEEPGSVLGFGF